MFKTTRVSSKQWLALILLTFLLVQSSTVYAEQSTKLSGQVSMTVYEVRPGQNGHNYVVAPTGHLIPLPGSGPQKNAQQLAVFRDQLGNYWYIDRNNNHVRINAADIEYFVSQTAAPVFKIKPSGELEQTTMQDPTLVEHKVKQQQEQLEAHHQVIAQQQQQLEARYQVIAQQQQTVQQLQQQLVQQQNISAQQQVQQQKLAQKKEGSGLGSVLATGIVGLAGAAAGVAAGAAIANRNNRYYYNGRYYDILPYGQPLFRQGAKDFYYWGSNGKRTFFHQDRQITPFIQQWRQQSSWRKR